MIFNFKVFDVVVENFTFAIEELDKDEFLNFLEAEKTGDIPKRFEILINKTKSIKIVDDKGKSSDIDVNDMKSARVPYSVMSKLVRRYTAGMFKDLTAEIAEASEQAEKKEESPTA